jgi:predicted nucleic acid-binding protein
VTVFVDSSAWYSAADADDVNHSRMAGILREAGPLLTSDHVLVETWFLANRRLGRPAAERFLERSIEGGLEIEFVIRSDIERAIDIGRAYADQTFSLVDRTSFAVMERRGISRAASLDDDFAVYRFGPRRSRAFEILR